MHMKIAHHWLLFFVISASGALAQEAGPALPEADIALSFDDSLSIFRLFDSLLQQGPASELHVRIGYNSNVLSAGRTLGIENFGLSPGLSYFHTSGAYADVTGYWSNDFEPAYYLTVASVGYMYMFSKKISVMAGYDRYFYAGASDDDYIPYSNTLSVTPMLDVGPLSLSANYAFYFGDIHVHRIMPGISITLEKRKWKGMDRVAITPSFYALFGNDVITELRFPDTLRELIRRVRQGLPWYELVEHNEFGVMNYTFSVPVSVRAGAWSITFTYNYSVPKALPGETLSYGESTFLSGTISHAISLGRREGGL